KLVHEYPAVFLGNGLDALRILLEREVIRGPCAWSLVASIQRLRCDPGHTDARPFRLVGHPLQASQIRLEARFVEVPVAAVVHAEINGQGGCLVGQDVALEALIAPGAAVPADADVAKHDVPGWETRDGPHLHVDRKSVV